MLITQPSLRLLATSGAVDAYLMGNTTSPLTVANRYRKTNSSAHHVGMTSGRFVLDVATGDSFVVTDLNRPDSSSLVFTLNLVWNLVSTGGDR